MQRPIMRNISPIAPSTSSITGNNIAPQPNKLINTSGSKLIGGRKKNKDDYDYVDIDLNQQITPETWSVAVAYGNSGGGKTTFATTFPSPFFIATENGTSKSSGAPNGINIYKQQNVEPLTALFSILKKLEMEGPHEQRKTIVFDHLGALDRLFYIRAEGKLDDNKKLSSISYSSNLKIFDEWAKFFDQLTLTQNAMNAKVLFLCHDTGIEKNSPKKSQDKFTTFDLSAKVRSYLTKTADTIFHCYIEQNEHGNNVFKVACNSNPYSEAKNRMDIDEPMIVDRYNGYQTIMNAAEEAKAKLSLYEEK